MAGNPRQNALHFPLRGQAYSSADGAQTGLPEGIIKVYQPTVLTALTFSGEDLDPNDRFLNTTLVAGTELPGRITGFTVSSGLIFHARS